MTNGFDCDVHLSGLLVQDAKAGGIVAIGRYLKNLLPSEVAYCKQYGMGLWLIYEGMGDAATMSGGYARGLSDGHIAARQANLIGAPTSVPIAAAVDFGAETADLSDIDAYMSGFAVGIAPRGLMVYGDGDVLTSHLPAGTKAYVAGAGGWPGTHGFLAVNKSPALVQHPPATLFGIDTDPCDVNDMTVIWFPAGQAPVVVVPSQAPATPPAVSVMPALKDLQAAVGVTADGVWGPVTAEAVASYYSQ